jgi:hypothetical protein
MIKGYTYAGCQAARRLLLEAMCASFACEAELSTSLTTGWRSLDGGRGKGGVFHRNIG